MTIEERRFISYGQMYFRRGLQLRKQRQREETLKLTAAAKATKDMETRRGRYGKNGLTEGGRSNLADKD